MAYYIVPTGNETAGIYEMFKYVTNVATEGLFFLVMIIVIWIIAFLATKQYSNSRAFFFASFFCSILSMILATLDLLAPRFMYLFIIFTAIGFVWLKLETG